MDPDAVAEYYRAVGAPMAALMAGRPVRVVSGAGAPPTPSPTPASQHALAEAVMAGARGFLWVMGPGVPVCLRVSVGSGADIATAATAALSLIETAATIGASAVPCTDGRGGLLVHLLGMDDAEPMIGELARRAPELATGDPAAADGRALVTAPAAGALVAVPYSLVDSADGTDVVQPMTVDELAAVTAGMPLEPSPFEVPARLSEQGDLAAPLAG